jgi:hypothetical protein
MRRIVIMLLLLAGCGGGGGGGSDSSFAGMWDVTLQPTRNSCNQGGVTPFSMTVTVNQDGPRVVLATPGGVTLSGVGDDDGFTVAAIDGTSCDGGTPATLNYEVEFAQGSGIPEDEAAVFYGVESHCEGSLVFCRAEWSGSAVRR